MCAITLFLTNIGNELKAFDLLHSLKPAKILVIGDFMLDMYTIGSVKRISPEAPVPVLHVKQESKRPGGAGNAILNLISLGMKVVAVGRLGKDLSGHHFLESISEEGVDTSGIIIDPDFRTPLKSRMIAENQQLLRVDYEDSKPLESKEEKKILKLLPELLSGVELIAISDYAKGLLTRPLLSDIIRLGKERSIPIIVDPKGKDFSKYKGATLIKPNLSEAIAAAGLGEEATLDQIGKKILKETEIEALMITRSKEGISLFNKKALREDFPAEVHEVRDVTGAGDTVLAIISSALANGLPLADAARLANVAAGIAIERLGCARVTLDEVADRLSLRQKAPLVFT